MSTLVEATREWEEKRAAMMRAYELTIDRRTELHQVRTDYGRMEATSKLLAAEEAHSKAKDAAVQARMAMERIKHAVALRS